MTSPRITTIGLIRDISRCALAGSESCIRIIQAAIRATATNEITRRVVKTTSIIVRVFISVLLSSNVNLADLKIKGKERLFQGLTERQNARRLPWFMVWYISATAPRS